MADRNPRRRASAQHNAESHLRSVWAKPMKPDTELIAIDPGDRWTGVAFFATDDDGKWYCQDAQEFDPQEFEDALAELLLTPSATPAPILVWEKFLLYGDKAELQTGSEFETSQTIGAFKFIVRSVNRHVDLHDEAEAKGTMVTCELQGGMCADSRLQMSRVTWAVQQADIKKPTRGILNKKKIKSVAGPIAKELYGNRDHVKDAELHGWRYILKTLKGAPALPGA